MARALVEDWEGAAKVEAEGACWAVAAVGGPAGSPGRCPAALLCPLQQMGSAGPGRWGQQLGAVSLRAHSG